MNFIGKIPNGFNQLSQSAIAVTVDGVDQAIFTTSSFTVNQTITGSLFGTASFAQTSSFLLNNIDLSGSLRLYVSPSGSDSNDGTQPTKSFRTIRAAVESIGTVSTINPLAPKLYTIYVSTGDYKEITPITVPPGVAIIGDNLKTVRLTAVNPRKDYFHCHSGTYFTGLRIIDLQYPSFAFSFPCSTATGSVNANGEVTSLALVHSTTGYTPNQTNLDVGIMIESPDSITGSASSATARVNTDSTGTITAVNLTYSGNNYVIGEKFHVSIPAPISQQPYIFASPYIQNCSAISGPFTLDGQKVPINTPLPYDVNNILGSSVDQQGAGGGIRVDGNLVNPGSALQSFVADSFTQINQGGPGHLVINNGYAQFVSCFTTFCTYGFKVAAGGFGNVSNSVCDFGNFGLISKKNFPFTYNSASVAEDKKSIVASLQLLDGGNGYSSSAANTASLTITGGGGSGATAYGKVASGSITELILMTTGSGYITTPSLVFPVPTSGSLLVSASGTVVLSGVTEFLMTLVSGSRGVDISSNMSYSGSDYLVTGVASGSSANQRRITVFPAPLSIIAPNTASFTQLSNISTGGIVMEYVGSGVTYNALPKFGGIPSSNAEINEIAPGKIFFATIDNIGNFKVGKYFGVNQLTGEVTITTDNFSLAGISSIGPFKRNGSAVGVQLKEVSNVTSLQNSIGTVGQDTAPTQYAVQQYLISQGLTSTNVFAGNAATATTASYVTGSIFTSTNPALSASYAATASYSRNLQISGSINNVDYIDFNTGSATPAYKSGRVFWDNTDGALSVYNAEADITLQVGQESWVRVSNKTGAIITNGTPVRIIGAQGDVPKIVKAQSVQVSGSALGDNQIIGIATHDIEDNSIGYVTTQGLTRGVNTSAFTDGDLLFVSSSAGLLTNVIPQAPFEVIQVGICIKAGPGGSGEIFVFPTQPIDFGDLASAERGIYQYGDIWSYVQSGSVGVWRHGKSLSGSYEITGSLNVTQGITGSLLGTAATASHAPSYLPLAGGTISGSLTIQNNLTVLGSASIQYISESTLNIGTNLITVNTINPGARFGGLAVIDSGSSPQVSASFLYDSVQDEFIFVHKGSSSNPITSSHFVLGPETYDDLGNELYLSPNRIPKSVGNEHLNNSNITDSGTIVSINSNTQVTGSLIVTQGITGSFSGSGANLFDIPASGITGLNLSQISSGSVSASISEQNGLQVNTKVVATSFTGSLFGTASYVTGSIFTSANPALSASYALTASFAPSYVLISSTSSMLTPYVLTSVTSSMLAPYVLTSNTSSMLTPYVLTSVTSSMLTPYVLTSVTSSMLAPYVLTSSTSSMSVATASYVTGSVFTTTNRAANATSALTASFVNPLNQNVTITGSVLVGTGSNLLSGGSNFGFTPNLSIGMNTGSTGAVLDLRNTSASILPGDVIGAVQFSANYNTISYASSQIRATGLGTPSGGNTGGGNLAIWTSPGGSGNPMVERMRVTSDGQVLIGLTSSLDTTSKLIVSGSTVITGSLNVTQGISGSFSGSGANLFNIPASGITGLNLSQISSGSVSASISPNSGLQVNTNVTATSFTGSLFGTASFATTSSFATTAIAKDSGSTYSTNAIKTLTSAEYTALSPKDPSTLYFIV